MKARKKRSSTNTRFRPGTSGECEAQLWLFAGSPAEVITTEALSALYGAGVEVLHRSDGRLVVVGQPDTPAHHHDH